MTEMELRTRIRMEFASQAPVEIPDWFINSSHIEVPAVHKTSMRYMEYIKRRKEERFFAWRMYYADKMTALFFNATKL